MSVNAQTILPILITALLSASVPSVLVILSWIRNNTRLRRLEAGQDRLDKRMDDTISRFHNDRMAFQASMHGCMMSFQASLLEAVHDIRERVTVLESRRNA